MFTKWTKKESLKAAICFVVFFAGVLATKLPGYLSPLYWAIFPGLWFIVYRCMGELGMPVMWVICLTFIIVIALSIVMASMLSNEMIIVLMIPLLGTFAGGACVFFMKRGLDINIQKALTGSADITAGGALALSIGIAIQNFWVQLDSAFMELPPFIRYNEAV